MGAKKKDLGDAKFGLRIAGGDVGVDLRIDVWIETE
jgi:hypothetical protein